MADLTVFITKRLKINIPVRQDTAQRALLFAIVVLSVTAIALGILALCLSLSSDNLTIEAGTLITAEDITGDKNAYFGDGFDPECLNREGIYRLTVISAGEEREVRLRVKDTKAPDVVLKEVCFAVGEKIPDPMDYIESVYEPGGFIGEYLTEIPDLKSIGAYKMKVRYTDSAGNKTPAYEVTMHHVYDNQPPKIEVVSDVTVYVGESVSYLGAIRTSDNCIGKIQIELDESELDLTREGRYKVYVTAIDASGNRSGKSEVKVYVHSDDSIENELRSEIAKVARMIIRSDMSA